MAHTALALTLGPLARGALLLAVCVLALAAIALQFAKARALYGGDEVGEERVNCPSCGSRTPAEGGACEYCGESLEDGSEKRV